MKRLLLDKKGSSLVMVLITMSLMSILGVTVIMLTLSNLRLKSSQAGGQKQFYNDEGVVELIIAGLENDSEKCASYAYADALSMYAQVKTGASTETLNKIYQEQFLRYMVYDLVGLNVDKIANKEDYGVDDQVHDTMQYVYNNKAGDNACKNLPRDATKIRVPIVDKNYFHDTYYSSLTMNSSFADGVCGLSLENVKKAVDNFIDGTYETGYALYYSDNVIANYLPPTMVAGDDFRYTGNNQWRNQDNEYYVSRYTENDFGVKPEKYVGKTYDCFIDLEEEDGKYYIILRNLRVQAPDGQEYYSSILTDVRVTIPKTAIETYTEYLDYAMIADDQILVNKDVNVTGNLYAGTVNRRDDEFDGCNGIILDGSQLSVSGQEVVTRGDIVLKNGSNLLVNPIDAGHSVENYVWAENIRTEKVGGNNIILDASTNVSDDLELGAASDSLTLKHEYYGYNYTDVNNMGLAKDASAEFSSTISLNGGTSGKINSVNLTQLDKLMIAGTSYINKGTKDEIDAGINNSNIKLGESLAIKSSQLVYYVPEKYVISSTDYAALDAADQAKYESITLSGSTYYFNRADYRDKYANFDVWTYLDTTNPIVSYRRSMDGVEGSDGNNPGPIYYYYLNVKTTGASDFYKKFMDNAENSDDFKKVGSHIAYISDISSGAIITSAGNILYNTDVTSGGTSVKLGNSNPDSPTSSLTSYTKSLNKEYMSLQMSLLTDYAVATEAVGKGQYRLYNDNTELAKINEDTYSKSGRNKAGEKKTNMFDTILDRSKLANSVTVADGTLNDGTAVKFGIWVSDSDITYDGTIGGEVVDSGIIITQKSVKLRQSFNGLIITGEDIIIESDGISVNANSDAIDVALNWDASQDSPVVYEAFNEYFRASVDASIKSGDEANKGNVQTLNWVKNGLDK